jgi:hypothetical protein
MGAQDALRCPSACTRAAGAALLAGVAVLEPSLASTIADVPPSPTIHIQGLAGRIKRVAIRGRIRSQVLLSASADADARVRAASLGALRTLVQGGGVGAVSVGACFSGALRRRVALPHRLHTHAHARAPDAPARVQRRWRGGPTHTASANARRSL